MPNSNLIDERVVQMRMDNEQFEKGAERTMGTLEKLKKSLNFKDTKIGNIDTSPLENALDKIGNKVEIFKKRVIENIADTAVDIGKNILTGADYITPGFRKYEEQIQYVQKLINASGRSMDDVQKISDKILWFTDETSYEYTAMMKSMASFASSGVQMEDAMNIILGLAVEAGKAGASASEATHAFTGFERAIAQGYMGTNQWQWIKTAGMNTNEFQQELINAAIATGDLQASSEGLAQTLKGTIVTADNFGITLGEKWLSAAAVTAAAKKYSVAVGQIYEVLNSDEYDFDTVKEAMDAMGDSFDKWSLDAFRAGQETKTWTDAVTALKSAMSSGWMKSFELIIGNYKEASGFFTNLIEDLWDIFVTPGENRNEFLEYAFGKKGAEGSSASVKKTVANWDKLKKKLEETGHTVNEIEEAFKKVAGSSEDAQVQALVKDYRDLEEAIKQGAVSGDLLNEVLNNVAGVTTGAAEAMVEGAVDATAALEQYKQVAMEVLRGDYGDGQARKDAIEAMGLDYDMVQWLAGNLKNGKGFDAITLEWFQSTAPNTYQRFIDTVGNGNIVIDSATGQIIALGDVVDELTESVDPLTDKIKGMTGRELWQGSVINLVKAFSAVLNELGEAFNTVFGDAESRGKGFRNILERFYRFTLSLSSNETLMTKFRNAFQSILKIAKAIPPILSSIYKIFKPINNAAMSLFDQILGLFTGNKSATKEFGTLGSILEKLSIIFENISEWVTKISDKIQNSGFINTVFQKLKDFSFKDFFAPLTDLFSGKSTLKDTIFGFLDGFKKKTDDVTKSVETLDERSSGLQRSFSGLGKLGTVAYEGIFGDRETFKTNVSQMLEDAKTTIINFFKNLKKEDIVNAGRMGLTGILLYRINQAFKNFGKALNTNGPILTLATSFGNIVNMITLPFVTMSKAIETQAKADSFVKIALAISLLAGSIYLLCSDKIDIEKFTHVAMSIAFIMLILSRIAKNMEGFQLFSNNTWNKSIKKDNPINASVKLLENFKTLINDIHIHDISLLPKQMGILLGVASVIASIIYAISKLRDVKSVSELVPQLTIIGSILLSLITFLVIASAAASRAPKAGGLVLSMALSIVLITNTLVKLGQMENVDWGVVVIGLLGIMGVIGIMALFMSEASRLGSSKGDKKNTGEILAIAAVVLSIAIAVKTFAKAVKSASEIENVGKAIGLLVTFVGTIVLLGFALLGFFAAIKAIGEGAKNINKTARALLVISAALLLLVPAIALMSFLNPKGLLAAAGALAILAVGLAGALAILSKIDAKKLMLAAAAFTMISIGMGLLMGSMLLLGAATVFLVSKVDWASLTKRFNDFKLAMDIILPTLGKLALAVLGLGIGLLAASVAVSVFGLSFLLVSGGIFLCALAVKTLAETLPLLGEGLPKLAEGLVKLYDVVDQNGWKVIVTLGLLAAIAFMLVKLVKGFDLESFSKKFDGLSEKVGAGLKKMIGVLKTLGPTFLKLIVSFLGLGMTLLISLIPLAITKLVKLIVTFILSLSRALSANSGLLIAAFEDLFGTIFGIALKALGTFLGDLIGFLGSFIAEAIRAAFPKRKSMLNAADRIEEYFGGDRWRAESEGFSQIIDNAINKSFRGHKIDLEAGVVVNDPEGFGDWEDDADLQAEMEEFNKTLEELGDEAGTSLAQHTTEAATNELSGKGESSGLAGILGEVLGGSGQDLLNGGIGDSLDGSSLLSTLQEYAQDTAGSEEVQASFGEGGDSAGGSFIDSIVDAFSNSENKESVANSAMSLANNVLSGETVLSAFTTGGKNQGKANITGVADYINGEEASSTLTDSAKGANDVLAAGWNNQSNLNVFTMAQNTILGLVNRIREAVDQHMSGAGAYAFDSFQGAYEERAAISSPSRVMEKEGEYTAEGLIKGIKNKLDEASGAGNELGNAVFNGHAQAIATGIMASQQSSDLERWKILQDGQEQLYWRQQDLNQTNLQGGNPLASAWDSLLNDAADSDTWVDALEGSLSDEMNQENVNTAIGNMIGMTFDGETSTQKFTESGNKDGLTWTTGLSDGIVSEESTALLMEAGQVINDAASNGWTAESDINTPAMTTYMVNGLTTSFYTDPALTEQLEQLGASLYRSVERGLRNEAGIASPSKEMAKNGMYLMMGLANGLEEGQTEAFSFGAGSIGYLLNAFHNAITQMLASINSDMSLQPVITPVVDMNEVNSAISGIQNGFGNGYSISAELANSIGRRAVPRQETVQQQPSNADAETGPGIVVNVYPSQGMDERALADKVYYKIREAEHRTRVAKG